MYYDAYSLWKTVFDDTFKTVISPNHIQYSDDFLLQKELGVLTLGRTPIGVILFSELDLSSPIDLDRSYFKNYPKHCLDQIKANHKHISIISNLAIHPEFRKSITHFSYSSCLIALGIKRFLESQTTALVTITRNDRKTHESVRMLGGQSLYETIVHGIGSNVFVIDEESALRAFNQLDLATFELINNFWNQSKSNQSYNNHIYNGPELGIQRSEL